MEDYEKFALILLTIILIIFAVALWRIIHEQLSRENSNTYQVLDSDHLELQERTNTWRVALVNAYL